MRSIFKGGRGGWFLLVAGLIAAAFIGGILVMAWLGRRPGPSVSSSNFGDADRLRYRAALEKLRYELRAAPGSPPFEQAMGEDQLLAAIAEDDKKARLLREKCGLEITDDMIREEYERLKADPGDTPVLAAIVGALDHDPAAVIEFWMRPTLVDRYLRACVATDDRLNAPAKKRIEELRQSGASGVAVTLNLTDSGLEPEDRAALSAAGGRTETVESPADFHFFVIGGRTGDTIAAGLVSAPKPRFEDWFKSEP